MKSLVVISVALLLFACATVPQTGRRQLRLISASQEMQLGTDAYRQILAESKLSENEAWQRMVREVGADIARVVDVEGFEWEFNVLAGEDVNAFALPGGKVAFYEGIMPVCGDRTGVAVVMGHEVAHVIAHHGAERMSQGLGTQIIGEVLAVGLGNADPGVRQGVLQAYGLGAQVGVMLPFSRKHESEADEIGLTLMAKAGYDPRAAVAFWQRMSDGGGSGPPEFLSTHPSGQTRIDQLQRWMPEALQHYQPR